MKLNIRLLRELSGLDQTNFWKRVGITQSGGSRYENNERRVPKPVESLLRLVYVEKVDINTVKHEDVELVAYLKTERKDEYMQLRKDAAKYFNPTL